MLGDWIVGSIDWSRPLTKPWDPRVDWWPYTKRLKAKPLAGYSPGPLSGPAAFWAGRPPGGWEK